MLKTIHIVAIQVQKIIILQYNHLSLLKNEVTVPTNQTNKLNEEINQNESTVSVTGAKTNDSLIAGVTQGAINVHINNNSTTPIIINHGGTS